MRTKIIATLASVGLFALAPSLARADLYGSALVRFENYDPSAVACFGRKLWWNTATNVLWICESNTFISTLAAAAPSFPLLAPDSTVSVPSYSFTNAPNFGILHEASDPTYLKFGAGAGNMVALSTAEMRLPALLRTNDGSGSAPSHSFIADNNTGMYRASSDTIGISTGGVNRWLIGNTANTFNQPLLGATGCSAPAYSFTSLSTSGLCHQGGSTIALRLTGVNRLTLTTSTLTSSLNFFVPTSTVSGSGLATTGYSFTGQPDSTGFGYGSGIYIQSGTVGETFRIVLDPAFDLIGVRTIFYATPGASTLTSIGAIGSAVTNLTADTSDGNAQTTLSSTASSGSASINVISTADNGPLVRITRQQAIGDQPTFPSCTGLDTGIAELSVASTDTAGYIVLSPTGTPAASGTCTVTFSSPFGSAEPICVVSAGNVTGTWNDSVTVITGSGLSTTTLEVYWSNSVPLAAGSVYNIGYICLAQ